jgi:HEPN domain-containing protein
MARREQELLGLAESYLKRAWKSLESGDYSLAVDYARSAAYTALRQLVRSLGFSLESYSLLDAVSKLPSGYKLPEEVREGLAVLDDAPPLEVCDCNVPELEVEYTRSEALKAVKAAEELVKLARQALEDRGSESARAPHDSFGRLRRSS